MPTVSASAAKLHTFAEALVGLRTSAVYVFGKKKKSQTKNRALAYFIRASTSAFAFLLFLPYGSPTPTSVFQLFVDTTVRFSYGKIMIPRCPSWCTLVLGIYFYLVALSRPDLPEGDISDPAVCSRPGAERPREGVHPRLSQPGPGRAAFGDGLARPSLPQGQERRGGAAHVMSHCLSMPVYRYFCHTGVVHTSTVGGPI